jgi:hypothetical protein
VSTRSVERARAGHNVGAVARNKLTACAIKHARAQLRAAGIRPPIDPEAVLAAYLDRERAIVSEPLLCGCGCRQLVTGRRRYVDQAHRQAAYRQRKAA